MNSFLKLFNGNIKNSIESFFKLYPYYDDKLYKLYNNDLEKFDKIQLMIHWHLYGKKENRICSDKYFNILYPEFNEFYTENIYEFKNSYHKQRINVSLDNSENIKYKIEDSDKNTLSNNFTILDYEKYLYNTNINYDNINITFIIISTNINKLEDTLNSIKLLNNNNWKIILILNGNDFNNTIIDEKLLNIIKIPLQKNYLIKNYLIKNNLIKGSEWISFINEGIILNKNYFEILQEKLNYRDDLDIIIFDPNYTHYIFNIRIFINNILFIDTSDKFFFALLKNLKYKILYNDVLINDKIDNFNKINYLTFPSLYNSEINKNIIVNLNNNLGDNLFNVFFGLLLAYQNKYNFNIIYNENITNKFTIFNGFNEIKFIDKSFNYELINSENNYFFNNDYLELKNYLNFEKEINLFKYLNFLDSKRKTIGIYISEFSQINENYYLKCLSELNYHEMNIIVYIEQACTYSYNFLKYINYYSMYKIINDGDQENIFFLLSNCDYIITNITNFSLWIIYLSNATKIYIYYKDIEILDKIKMYKSNIILIDDIFDEEYLINNILITEYNEKWMIYNSLCHECTYKIQKIIDDNLINKLGKLYINQNIIEKYQISNDNLIDKSICQELILPIQNNNKCIQIIFVINENTSNIIIDYNISLILNQFYDNYNIIIFLNNVVNNYIKYNNIDNIYIFSSNKIYTDDNIITYLTKLSDYNSIIIIPPQNLILPHTFLLDHINLSKKNQKNQIKFVYKTYYNYPISNINEYLLFDKNNNLFSKYNEEHIVCQVENSMMDIFTNQNYLDFLLFLYKNNQIKYKLFESKINSKINNINSDIQFIIFLNANSILPTNINIPKNACINIIEFNDTQSDPSKIHFTKYNYFYLDTTDISYKYKFNKALAYNLMIKLLIKHNFIFKYIYFYNSEISNELLSTSLNLLNTYDIIQLNSNSEITNNISFIIQKYILKEVGYFDPEIFYNNDGLEILFFIEKIKKLNNIKIWINIDNNSTLLCNMAKYINILNTSNINILLDFLKNRDIINYQIFDKIKTYIINLDERTDRLYNSINECHKINLYNIERFPAIKPNSIQSKNSTLINPTKILKKNNIDYFKGALGCKMSHLEVLKKSLDVNEEFILILEDDVMFEDNTIIYLNLSLINLENIDWDILFLSVNLKEINDVEKKDHNILKVSKCLTTTAQLFKKKNIEKIINIIEKSDTEIDNTYSDLITNKYCIYPMCVYQCESYSNILNINLNYGYYHRKFEL